MPLKQTFNDFVGVDEDVQISGERTKDDIVVHCVSMLTDSNSSEDENDWSNGTFDTDQKSIPKKQEALDVLETILRFCEFSDTDKSIFHEVKKHINNTMREYQKTLTDFLK
jgi:hypothetical protein